jgi:hypothetical protein
MLISEAYREQNKQLHKGGIFGTSGHKMAPLVGGMAIVHKTRNILDYGCGQRLLENALGFPIKNYDPCIEGLDAPPEPANIVVCGDVLEHIEPECLDAVLDDLHRVTHVVGMFHVDTRPAMKTLPDGRNAHLIQQPAEWWFPKFFKRWSSVHIVDQLFESRANPGVIKSLGFYATVERKR